MKKKTNKKEYAVIGMGDFGVSLTKTLASSGVSVIAIDRHPENLEKVSDCVTQSFCADVSNHEALMQLGVEDCDVVVVAIGDDLKSSMLITIQLKEMGVEHVICKAKTDLEKRLLKKIGASQAIITDRIVGARVARELMSGHYYEAIELSENYSMVQINVPTEWIGKSLTELNVRKNYNVNVVGKRNGDDVSIIPDPEEPFKEDDELMVLGHNADLAKLEE